MNNSITIGDVWEEITKIKKMTNQHKDVDNITCRLTKTRSNRVKMVLNIGIEICDLLKWKSKDRIMILRNKLNGTLLKLTKSSHDGYTLVIPNKSPRRMNVNAVIDPNKKYILENTKIVSFEMEKNHIIVDISSLVSE